MNERIKQFERESGLEIYGLGLDRVKWNAVLEKFSEMIIKECATVADCHWRCQCPGVYVKEHFFGVDNNE